VRRELASGERPESAGTARRVVALELVIASQSRVKLAAQ
jgi:hypothetical protein